MSVAKVIEVKASSKTGVEDAIKQGLKKCAETVKNVQGAWVKDIKLVTEADGKVTEWRVDMKVTFLVK